jgi:hypothetical protein
VGEEKVYLRFLGLLKERYMEKQKKKGVKKKEKEKREKKKRVNKVREVCLSKKEEKFVKRR